MHTTISTPKALDVTARQASHLGLRSLCAIALISSLTACSSSGSLRSDLGPDGTSDSGSIASGGSAGGGGGTGGSGSTGGDTVVAGNGVGGDTTVAGGGTATGSDTTGNTNGNSSGNTGTDFCSRMRPPSGTSLTICTVAPVSCSPARSTASCTLSP